VKDIITLLSAALAPITAVVALGIAYRQYRLEHIKLRQTLYERRLAIFNSAMQLLSHIMQDADIKMEQLFKFLAETNQSYFLLGEEISEYLTELYKKGVDLSTTNQRLHHSNLPGGEERTRLAHEKGELLKWFGDQFTVARKKFAKHLALDK
jgi:hypothetical protein